MDSSHATASFGAWVKERRRGAGLTQGELARRVGIAEVTLRKIEADERRPSPPVAALIAEQLALGPEERARFLLAARAALSPDQLPAPLEASPHRGAPPLPPSPLIGRERELADLLALLAGGDVRLLTLSGPPGIGKTRLALELAHRAAGFLACPVSFVSLAPIADPELVALALAQALDVTPASGEPLLRRLVARLQGRRLLVLDNFEQVLAAAPLVAELVAACADLKVVVTSRAALRLRAEHEQPVPPLPWGAEVAPADAGEPAVRLFAERAQAISRSFRLTAANAATVAAICAHLDGLPLAIELAAARTRTLSLTTLLERLERRLDLLTAGPADLPARQRTLRGAIAWSYELLSPAEARLLDWLGAFVGGFTLEDLERVLALAPAEVAAALPSDQAATLLATLLDHSLARADADPQGALRFSMLETIRAFARERLAEGDGAVARCCHAEHYCALAAAMERQLTTGLRGAAIQRAERESDNLRAALAWAVEAGEEELALRLGHATAWLWRERDKLGEGRAWLARLLALPAAAGSTPARASMLAHDAELALRQGDYVAGVALARASVAIFGVVGERRGHALSQATLAWGLTRQGERAAGLALLRESLGFWREAGEPVELARALSGMAWVHRHFGELATARGLLDEALALLRGGPHVWLEADLLWELSEVLRLSGDAAAGRELFDRSMAMMRLVAAEGELHDLLHIRAWQAYRAGDYTQAAALFDENAALLRGREGVDRAWALSHAADARRCAGDYEGAAAGYAESLAIFRAHGHRQGQAAMLHNLGYIARARGDLAAAAAAFRESLQIFRAIGYTWSIADALYGLAAVAAARGEARLAARLMGAASAAHQAIDASSGLIEPANKREWQRTEADLAARLLPAQIEAARAEGRALSLDAAAELGLGAAGP